MFKSSKDQESSRFMKRDIKPINESREKEGRENRDSIPAGIRIERLGRIRSIKNVLGDKNDVNC